MFEVLEFPKPGDEGGELPPVVRYDDRDVSWMDWSEVLPYTHAQFECEDCGYTGRVRFTVGIVHPQRGETFPMAELKGLRSGRQYGRDVAHLAWPVRRLVAFRCMACRRLTIDDTRGAGGFERDDIDHPTFDARFELGEGRYHET